MITIPVSTPWNVCTPTLFRYLPSEYVDAFFEDGSLRLSSFAAFKQHTDEQRLDRSEGDVSLALVTEQPESRLLFSRGSYGLSAYVLSATMRHEESLMSAFGCDSYIRINDPTEFGIRVARHVPSFQAGFEGPCLYQEGKHIYRDVSYMDTTKFFDSEHRSNINKDRVECFTREQMQHLPFFLKHKTYAQQAEYRLLWGTASSVDGFLDVKVPEAIPFCSRPRKGTE